MKKTKKDDEDEWDEEGEDDEADDENEADDGDWKIVFYPHFDLVVTVQSAPYRYRYRGESNGICSMPPLPRRLHGHRYRGEPTGEAVRYRGGISKACGHGLLLQGSKIDFIEINFG